MTNGVIRVALERDVRTPSRHPHVERIMQKQIRQDGAYDPSLRRSRHSRHDAAILHLHRSLQPALDVEQHPRSVRMTTDRSAVERMRLTSSDAVIVCAEQVMLNILEAYAQPDKNFDDLRRSIHGDQFRDQFPNKLRDFSEACKKELG